MYDGKGKKRYHRKIKKIRSQRDLLNQSAKNPTKTIQTQLIKYKAQQKH